MMWMKGIFWGYYTVGNDVILIARKHSQDRAANLLKLLDVIVAS